MKKSGILLVAQTNNILTGGVATVCSRHRKPKTSNKVPVVPFKKTKIWQQAAVNSPRKDHSR